MRRPTDAQAQRQLRRIVKDYLRPSGRTERVLGRLALSYIVYGGQGAKFRRWLA